MPTLIEIIKMLQTYPDPTLTTKEQIVYEEIFYLCQRIEGEIRETKDALDLAYTTMLHTPSSAHVMRQLDGMLMWLLGDAKKFKTWISNCFEIDHFPSTQESIFAVLNQFDVFRDKALRLQRELSDIEITSYWSNEFNNAHIHSNQVFKTITTLAEEMRKAKALIMEEEV